MGVRGLIGRALRPGVSLAHSRDPAKLSPVDALHALGKVESAGACLIHARWGYENIPMLRTIILDIAAIEFDRNGWTVKDRRRYTAGETMKRFVDQVIREYLSELCHRCQGHGVLGIKLDTVRHSLTSCPDCKGDGRVKKQMDMDVAEKGVEFLLKPWRDWMYVSCSTCGGKRVVTMTKELKAGRLRSCTDCEGTGLVLGSHRARARAMGYDVAHMYRVWKERFYVVLGELRTIERRAMLECVNHLTQE